jgi:predicted hydrolase (HD superfamily)
MRALARCFGEDQDRWALAGLFHDLMSRAVVHADAIAGLLVAAALVRPERSAGMKVSSVKKKLKERSFAPGVNREEIYGVEATLGLPLEEFIAASIAGLQQVAPEIGL